MMKTKTYKNPQINIMIQNYQAALKAGNVVRAIMIKHALWSRHHVQVGPTDSTILDTLRTATPGQRIIKAN